MLVEAVTTASYFFRSLLSESACHLPCELSHGTGMKA